MMDGVRTQREIRSERQVKTDTLPRYLLTYIKTNNAFNNIR